MKTTIVKAFTLFVFIGILLVLLWLYSSEHQELSEVFFFAGAEQDAILIRYKEHSALIDTAEEQNSHELIAWLESLGVEEIDVLILTHPDKDHIGGAEAVFEHFVVKQVFRSLYFKGSDLEQRMMDAIAASDALDLVPEEPVSIDWDGITLDLYPPGAAQIVSSNDASIIVVLQHEEIRMVMAGDAEDSRLAEMLAYPIASCDLYKLPHHGRDSTLSAQAIVKLCPQYAVITAKKAEPSVLAALESIPTETFYTRNQGVAVVCNGRKLNVKYLN